MRPDNSPRRARFGPYEVDFRTQELRKYGTRLKLSGQPLQILEMLLDHPGQLVTREALQGQLWSEHVFVDSNHGLNAAVNKLRDALGDSAEEPKYIETLPRRGYRFIGTVQPEPWTPLVPHTEPLGSGMEAQESAMRKGPQATVGRAMRPRAKRWVRALFASAALLLCGIAVSAFLSRNSEKAERIPKQSLKHAAESLATAALNSQGAGELSGPPNAHTTNRAAVKTAWRKKPDEKDAVAQGGHDDGGRGAGADEIDQVADRGVTGKIPVVPPEARLRSGPTLRTVVAGDGGNAAPQFSPDGKRIAFMSNRTGPWQIWVSAVDGSNPRQVSFTESAGTPRWSPDGRSIAFDAPFDGETRIFVVTVDANEQARPLVEGLVPSFSRDGKWIYFASDRTGDWQVWKVPARGGSATQVTDHGGFAALESSDGYVYYSKSRYPQPEICRVPVNGGIEACALQHLRPRTWASWAVTRQGIVFAEDLPNGQSSLSFYDPSRRQVRDLVMLHSAPFWVGATADGKRAIMNDASERQISMVENLR